MADAISNEDPDPEISGFLAQDDGVYNTSCSRKSLSELIYDFGASRLTVCDFSILLNPIPKSKNMNTYGGKAKITRMGKLDIGGMLIYPVYYAPQGPRNLVSATQLEDNGLKIVH